MKYKEEYCLKRELVFDRKGSQETKTSCEPFLFTLNICWNFSSQIHQLISSIRFRFHPSNCMIILCNVVPWRNVSTLGASAYFLICSTACCHCSSAFASKSFLGLCLLHTTLKFCNALLYRHLHECNVSDDTARTLHGTTRLC